MRTSSHRVHLHNILKFCLTCKKTHYISIIKLDGDYVSGKKIMVYIVGQTKLKNAILRIKACDTYSNHNI